MTQTQVAARGQENSAAKLTEEQVRLIRTKHKAGVRISGIVKELSASGVKVSWGCVKGIVTGRRWGWLK